MKLYEIEQSILDKMAEAEQQAIDNDGVVEDSIVEALEELQLEKETKIEGVALYIKNELALIEAIKVEQAVLMQRRKACENKVQRLKEFIGVFLNGEKLKTAKCNISYRNTQSVNVADTVDLEKLAEINKDYVKVTITREPVKKELKKAMDAGEDIYGVSLMPKRSTIIK